MTAFLVLSILALVGAAGSIVAVACDGYRPRATRGPFDRIRPL